jgi:hypothetical protein
MHFAIIKPATQETSIVDCPDIRDAQALAGLSGVDHGVVARGLGIVVYEFGLMVPAR